MINLSLSIEQTQNLINLLNTMPHGQVRELIDVIYNQAVTQVNTSPELPTDSSQAA